MRKSKMISVIAAGVVAACISVVGVAAPANAGWGRFTTTTCPPGKAVQLSWYAIDGPAWGTGGTGVWINNQNNRVFYTERKGWITYHTGLNVAYWYAGPTGDIRDGSASISCVNYW